MHLAITFCYSFVLGTALPMMFASRIPAWQIKFFRISLLQWSFFLSLLCGILAFILSRKKQKKSFLDEYAVNPQPSFFLNKITWLMIFCSLLLAFSNYYWNVDTSSSHHILNFIDQSFSDRTLIRGTIVRDPDDRGNFAFIDIQPEEIVKFSKNEFQIDLQNPYVEFRAKVEKVIDGDTIEIFESPPSWLIPNMGAGRSVRLFGINAPEIPEGQYNLQELQVDGEPGGDKAKNFLKKMLEGRSVILRIAKSEPQDRYGRWLALVYLPGQRETANEKMLKKNLAKVSFLSTEGLVKLKPESPIKLTGKTGYVRIKIYPTIGEEMYGSLSYGQRIEVDSALLPVKRKTNPSGFDYGRYLLARNIYAMPLPIRKSENIRVLGEEGMNPLIALSLKLKKKMTAVIRETMPYPESAFLGGVTLGLRGGVPDKIKREFQATGVAHVLAVSGLHVGFVAVLLVMVSSLFNLSKKFTFALCTFGLIVFAIITGASPATIRSVLMFSIGQFFHSFAGLGLRSSTVMTIPVAASIILLFDPLLLPDGSFVLSFMAVWSLAHLSRPVENFFRFNTLTRGFVFFPYFFLLVSLTAVSLFGIAGEIEFLWGVSGIFKKIPQMSKWLPNYLKLIGGGYVIGVLIYFLFKRVKKIDLIESVYCGRGAFLRGMMIFTCAQLAILIGMMWPLSSVYFQRFPISGSFANFLAIPLIGFIVQYGLIASSLVTTSRLFLSNSSGNFLLSLIGLAYTPIGFGVLTSLIVLIIYLSVISYRFIKYRGNIIYDFFEDLQKFAPSLVFVLVFVTIALLEKYFNTASQIALRIQAFNWVLCEGFLSMARNWAGYIPYPYVDTLSPHQIVLYYGLILVIALYRPIWNGIKKLLNNFYPMWKPIQLFKWVFSFFVLVGMVGVGISYSLKQQLQKLSVTFFDCGQGNAILIHTPNKKAILIDGGWGAQTDASEEDISSGAAGEDVKKQSQSGWDFGESVIATTLSKYRIRTIDLIVNTSPRPGNLSAIPYVIDHFPVKELVIPFSPESILASANKTTDYENFMKLSGLTDVAYVDDDGSEETLEMPDRFEPYLKSALGVYENLLKKKNLKIKTARSGALLYQESCGDKKLILTALYPSGEVREGKRVYKKGDDPLGSRTIVLKLVYGQFSCLIPTQISLKAMESLKKKKDELKSDILLLPKNGHPFWNSEEFLKSVRPEVAVVQYGFLSGAQSKLASVRMKDWYLFTTEKRLQKNKISCYRTDRLGAIIVQSDGAPFNKTKDITWILN